MLPQRPAGFQYEPLLVLAVPASEFLGQREKERRQALSRNRPGSATTTSSSIGPSARA